MNATTNKENEGSAQTTANENSSYQNSSSARHEVILKPSKLQSVVVSPTRNSPLPKSRGRPSSSALRSREAQNCTTLLNYYSPKRKLAEVDDSDSVDNPTLKKTLFDVLDPESSADITMDDTEDPPNVTLQTLLSTLNQMSDTNKENFSELSSKVEDLNKETNSRIDTLIEQNQSEMASMKTRLDKVEDQLSSGTLTGLASKIARLDTLISRQEKEQFKLDIIIKGLLGEESNYMQVAGNSCLIVSS